MDDRTKRLREFRKIPPLAQLDHRRFLDKSGNLTLLSHLSRKERRRIKVESKKIGFQYQQIINSMTQSGPGFPVDQLLRSMAIEYTHRFASSGTEHLPISFNYFEPFCEGKLITKSFAPYMIPLDETNYLFHASDFFEYITSSEVEEFDPSSLLSLPDSRVFHFTCNGDIFEISFTDARSRDYILSGFSLVRRNKSIHWCLIAGELLSDEEWALASSDATAINLDDISPSKRAFLRTSIEEQGGTTGPPMRLEGTDTAVKTVLAGEFDASTARHIAKAIFIESENAYTVFCDDPEVLQPILDSRKQSVFEAAIGRLDQAGALFSIAEGFLQLPSYFGSRVTIAKDIAGSNSIPKGLKGKGGRGISGKYEVIESVSVASAGTPSIIQKVELPQFSNETEGHWRRLKIDELGKDRDGNPIKGKTWVSRSTPWRSKRQNEGNIIYIKDSIAIARQKVSEIYKSEAKQSSNKSRKIDTGQSELYVLRCTLMKDEVYKVGWTSGSSHDRAKELSSASGVPLSFVVVESWKHDDAQALETEVHAILAPYRLNNKREFFELDFSTMKRIIDQTINRLSSTKLKNK